MMPAAASRPTSSLSQVEAERVDAGVVLKVLAESHGDDKLLFLLEHPAQGEHGVLPPVPALHFQ